VERLDHALQRSALDRKTHALIYVDRFKSINDSLGHVTGDEFLVAIGACMRSVVRSDDLLARFGGDEFVVLLEDVAGLEVAVAAARRICAALEQPIVLRGGYEVVASVSVGIALSEPGKSAALVRTWLKRSKAYATACGKKNGRLLSHMTTIDAARDMDSIRAALGQKQITYYGFSYGTYLAQVYSTLFPSHVRRLVMDSNVDPRDVWYKANLKQDVAFNRNIKIWFAWLAKYHTVYHLGSTEKAVEKLFYREEKRLLKHPAGGVIGPDEWVDVFLYAGYYEQTWLQLGSAFTGFVHKNDWKTIKDLFDSDDTPGDDNGFAVYNAVQCTDVQWPLSWAKWARDNWATYKKAPFETWGNAWFNAPCLYWPAKAHRPLRIDGSKVPSALLIDETLDAATPFPGSLEVRSLFPNAVLLAEPGGTTHADSLFGDLCVDNTIANYLALGQLPARSRQRSGHAVPAASGTGANLGQFCRARGKRGGGPARFAGPVIWAPGRQASRPRRARNVRQ
jgi:diguanylate cyclase (GGDEF)-like protein